MFAAMGMLAQGAGGLSDLTFSYTDNASAAGSSDTTLFSGLSFGAVPGAGEARFIVVMYHHQKDAGSKDITAIRINGSTATQLAKFNYTTGSESRTLVLGYLEVSTGTTGSAGFDNTAGGGTKAVGVYRVIGDAGSSLALSGSEVSDTGANPTLTISAVAGGIVFAGTKVRNGSDTTWTGLTGRYSVDASSGEWASGAADTISTTGSRTITTSVTGNLPAGMSACIIPAA